MIKIARLNFKSELDPVQFEEGLRVRPTIDKVRRPRSHLNVARSETREKTCEWLKIINLSPYIVSELLSERIAENACAPWTKPRKP